MFTSQGPSLRELAVQAFSSVERGYDLLAPKFDHTPFRTPDRILDAVEEALAASEGSFGDGLDVCCGTGAALGMLTRLCRGRVTGVDLSAGMLAEAERTHGGADRVDFVRADARALPADLSDGYDLAVSFGAFGHFLPAERPALFSGVYGTLRPGGVFAFPIGAPLPPSSPLWWAAAGFDAVMRVRNAVWRPPFVMYYRTFPWGGVRRDLAAAGFEVETLPLEHFGRRPDGSPRWRLVLARKPVRTPVPAGRLR
ncbi:MULTISPECIES: class I SAM-dependent methyltransferase [Streptomyces]|uniref:class I SAM-dependent methyltransferase n=1 Tax=Streptomyces TaxID=1883 RepID=UPI0016733E77|nr:MULTISPECIES: class I SAM-dependent methyltransferase [Streptomyces]MBD3579124.1 methyltransferase domain-containing protein [Streptomyces sp. KD18]GGT00179.1 methyltransferase [Streptomyces toxytricini]